MHDFVMIEHQALSRITGGAAPATGPNTRTTNGNIGVTVPLKSGALQIGVQGTRATSVSNYAECARAVRDMKGTPSDLRATCGLPSGS
jgi:hypothetical protein